MDEIYSFIFVTVPHSEDAFLHEGKIVRSRRWDCWIGIHNASELREASKQGWVKNSMGGAEGEVFRFFTFRQLNLCMCW